MSTFSLLAIGLGLLAGIINLGVALFHREEPTVLGLRLLAALLSFALPVTIMIAKVQNIRLVPSEWHNAVYLTLGLAIFVGITLMLPATIQRSIAPVPVESERRTTGKLSGDPGIRIATKNDEWVN